MLRCLLASALTGALVFPLAAAAASPAPIRAIATQTSSTQKGKHQTLTEALRAGGEVIGHDRIACLTLTQASMKCTAVFTLPKGQVKVAGTVHFDKPMSKLAITGGTGAYAGATGTLALRFGAGNKTTETFTFS